MRVNAWRLRQIFHLSQGDVDEARVCMRRAELLQLQENLGERYLGTTAALELSCLRAARRPGAGQERARCGARAGRAPPRMASGALYGEAACRMLGGDCAGALPLVEAGLELARPGRHVYFGQLRRMHVEVLIGLGRGEEALARARGVHARCSSAKQLGMRRSRPLHRVLRAR